MDVKRFWLTAAIGMLFCLRAGTAFATPTVTLTYTTAANSVSSYNKDVTLTATLTGTHTAGNIVFSDNGLQVAEVTITYSVNAASYTITNIYQGNHDFSATFTGTNGSATGTKNTTIGSAYLPVPIAKSYAGAWVDPLGTQGQSAGAIELETENFETSISPSYNLATHLHYFAWGDAWSSGTRVAQITDDIAKNRIPIISWQCGDTNVNVASGVDDASVLAPLATGLISLAGGATTSNYPIVVRWSWEMNNMENATTEETCMQSGPSYNDKTSTQAAHYVSAFQHIVTYIDTAFKNAGVRPNVIWDFNPGYWTNNCLSTGASMCSFTDPNTMTTYYFTNDIGVDPVATQFYPKDSYVDWIGIDTYNYSTMTYTFPDLPGLQSVLPNMSGLAFYPTYANTTASLVPNPPVNANGYDKPLIIGETGADKSTSGTDYQETFLTGAAGDLQSLYPQIKAFTYFDAPGNSPGESWVLDTRGGLAAFGTLATTSPTNYTCTYTAGSPGTLSCM